MAADQLLHPVRTPEDQVAQTGDLCAASCWSERYGDRHRLVRIVAFPAGVVAPSKVRLYWRHDHYVLQWWDPGARKNLSDRVDGDLVAVIAKARQIDERLTHFKTSGQRRVRRLTHAELVDRFEADLRRRAKAGEIDPRTVRRYAFALRHYLAFCQQPDVLRSMPYVAGVNREFRLAFAAFLDDRFVRPNGRSQGSARPMKSQAFVLDTVRGMYEWGIDADRGNILPDGFRNPFLRHGEARPPLRTDPLAEPDITLAMALELIAACDHYQLLLFAPMVLFGLRASEPCYLFREYLDDNWLRVPCNPDLAYHTKGRRDKRFPLPDELKPLWHALHDGEPYGLLYVRRAVYHGADHRRWPVIRSQN